jgi:hypothetical protein
VTVSIFELANPEMDCDEKFGVDVMPFGATPYFYSQ